MLAGVLFEHDVVALDQLQQFFVFDERRSLVSKRFPENVADIVFVRFKKRSDRERRMSSKLGDQFTRSPRMSHGLRRLRFQPTHDRNAVVTVDHE